MFYIPDKVLFVHIYKTGGTSVVAALRQVYGKTELPDMRPHTSAAMIKSQIGDAAFDATHSFATIRNPWDWQVSLYFYMLRSKRHPEHTLMQGLGSFTEYINWRCDPATLAERARCQTSLITAIDGTQLVNRLLRFEKLATDWEALLRDLGVNIVPLSRVNVGGNRHTDYRKHYTPQTRDRVGEVFADYISRFNYTFE